MVIVFFIVPSLCMCGFCLVISIRRCLLQSIVFFQSRKQFTMREWAISWALSINTQRYWPALKSTSSTSKATHKTSYATTHNPSSAQLSSSWSPCNYGQCTTKTPRVRSFLSRNRGCRITTITTMSLGWIPNASSMNKNVPFVCAR